MYCKYCGTELLNNSNTCPSCGRDLSSDLNVNELEQKIMENMEDGLILDPIREASAVGQQDTEVLWATGAETNQQGLYEEYDDGTHGGPYTVDDEYEDENEEEDKKSSRGIILGSVLMVLTTLLIIFAIVVTNPVNRFKRSLSDYDFVKAEEIYLRKLEGKPKQEKADALMDKAIVDLMRDYQKEKVTGEKAEEYLKQIISFWNGKSAEAALSDVKILEASKASFREGMSRMDEQDYAGAIECFRKVNHKDNHYKEAEENAQKCLSLYEEKCLKDAAEFEKQHQYDEAIAELNEAISYLGGNVKLKQRVEELTKAKEEYEIGSAKEEARALVDQGNYYEALKRLEEGLELHPNNRSLKQAISDTKSQYMDKVLQNAQEALGQGENQNFEAAVAVLDTAIQTLGGDYEDIRRVFEEKRSEYEDLKRNTPAARLVGVWQVTSIKVGIVPMIPSIYKLYSGKTGDHLQLEIYDNGTYYLELFGESESGSWGGGTLNPDESCTFTMNNNVEMRHLTMTRDQKLKMDYQGETYTFEQIS